MAQLGVAEPTREDPIGLAQLPKVVKRLPALGLARHDEPRTRTGNPHPAYDLERLAVG